MCGLERRIGERVWEWHGGEVHKGCGVERYRKEDVGIKVS